MCDKTTNVDNWMSRNCTEYALSQGSDFYTDLFQNFYQSSGGGLWIPGVSVPTFLDENLRFQNLLVDLCNQDGKYCIEPLDEICSGYTRQDTQNPIIRKVCGCFLPNDQYLGNRACDPICSSYDNLKRYNQTTCNTSICIIDNFTILAKGSSIGDITFQQTCPYCSPVSQCKCVISDLNLIIQDSRLGALNLTQNCPSDALECYTTLDGVRVKLDNCSDYIQSFGLTTSVVEKQKRTYHVGLVTFIVLTIVVIILFLIGVIYYFKT